jgi:hypothetical protein
MNTYILLGGVAVVLSVGGFVTGCNYHQAKAEKTIRALEHQYQDKTNQINGEKNAQIKALNTDLNTALVGLRGRTSSPAKTTDGKDCNGQALSAPDAEFLIREAARADEVRVSLIACYKQYEAIQ